MKTKMIPILEIINKATVAFFEEVKKKFPPLKLTGDLSSIKEVKDPMKLFKTKSLQKIKITGYEERDILVETGIWPQKGAILKIGSELYKVWRRNRKTGRIYIKSLIYQNGISKREKNKMSKV